MKCTLLLKKIKPITKWVIIIGLSTLMGIRAFLFIKVGMWLDAKYNPEHKLFLILGCILAMTTSLFLVLFQLKRLQSNEED